jgi:hypothetical protein
MPAIGMATNKQHELLSSAPPEVLAKVQELTRDAIFAALQRGQEERRAAEACESLGPSDSQILFR